MKSLSPHESGQADTPAPALAAGTAVYLAWLEENREVIADNGGTGDYQALLAALMSIYRLSGMSVMGAGPHSECYHSMDGGLTWRLHAKTVTIA